MEPAQALVAAVHADPSNHRAHRQVWEALAAEGRLDAAVQRFREALASHYRDAPPPARLPQRVRLEGVTLLAIDCLHPELTVPALRASVAQCEFDAVRLLTDRPMKLDDIEAVRIDAIGSREDYSRFLFRDLARHVDTAHALLVQWDGFVVDGSRWDEAFLLFDYIGPRWPAALVTGDPRHDVGNGGFSLRSRALLEALGDARIEPGHPEDTVICTTYRPYLESRHGIAFASGDVADRFAYEHCEVAAPTFGFHGIVNMSRHLPWPDLRTFDFLDG
jgi:hypothetical protein